MPATRDRKTDRDDELNAAPERTVALRYVGAGAALPDVPARDLFADEIGDYDRKALLASGLYEAA
jgi:hypothetical protein